jgi:hypothetical protein
MWFDLHKVLLCKSVTSWMGWLSFMKQSMNCIEKNMSEVTLKIDLVHER